MLESTCKLCEKVEHERIDNFLYNNLVKHMESEREKEKLQQMKTISWLVDETRMFRPNLKENTSNNWKLL